MPSLLDPRQYFNPEQRVTMRRGGPASASPVVGPGPVGEPVPGVSDDQRDAFLQSQGDGGVLPQPAFSSPAVTGQTASIQPGQLNSLARGGSSGPLFGGAGPTPESLGGAALPRIFNGPVEQDSGSPASQAITGMQDNLLQQHGMRQDLMRQLQGVGGIPGTSEAERQALRNSMINQYTRSLGLNTDAANMGRGLFTDAQRQGVGQYGIDPRTGGGTVGRGLDLQQQQTNFNTSQDRIRDQVAAGIVGQGGTAQEVQEGIDAFNAGRSGQQPVTGAGGGTPSAAGPASTTVPAATAPAGVSQLHRTLDQHLRSAAVGAGLQLPQDQGGRGAGRAPLTIAATTDAGARNNAMTNFVASLASSGQLTRENLPEVMSYMTQRFGADNANAWFGQRFMPWSGGAHRDSVGTIMNLANQPDAQGRAGNVGRRNYGTSLFDRLTGG